ERGVLVRHLVLPGHLDETEKILGYLASISPDIHVNIMDQYWPAYRAGEVEGLGRRVTREEMERALARARELGINVV
ncbi:MAG: radical SAM protein, partial [Thermoplasmata archaeon]|nr:radical SAM protein [Thermoplasmata archaeon]